MKQVYPGMLDEMLTPVNIFMVFSKVDYPLKTNMTGWKTMNEDIFPIEHEEFSSQSS